jgi:RNA polymerase sigma factor (TIGR02999 family)
MDEPPWVSVKQLEELQSAPGFRGALGPTNSQEVTSLLKAWSQGDASALDRLAPLLYDELRRLAHGYMRHERAGHTLQTTALVNEAYLRLVDVKQVAWQDRAHFFAVAARAMRRVLVDAARSRAAVKRGGRLEPEAHSTPIDFDQFPSARSDRAAELCALDDALTTLLQMDARRAQVIELRFFGGLSVEETAEVLKVSPQTVMRDWRIARAWLARELQR